MKLYSAEIEIAVGAVSEACRLARAVQDEIVATRSEHLKDDRSPVTMADLAAQVVVSRRLAAAFPDDPLLAEEDAGLLAEEPELARQVLELSRRVLSGLSHDDMVAALARGDHRGDRSGRFWILDPIDGTKGFLRLEQFAAALALVDGGQVVVAVLGCPNLWIDPADENGATGCLFSAVRGNGAVQRGVDGSEPRPVAVDGISEPGRATLCESVESGHSSHDRARQIADTLGITSPSRRMDSQCKYALVARGEASVYLRLPRSAGYHEKSWDHAAGALIVEEAGGRVSDLAGRPLDFTRGARLGNTAGIVATNGVLHERTLTVARGELGIE